MGIRQANRAAERALVTGASMVQGKRFGVVIECANAEVAGECGVSPNCAGLCVSEKHLRHAP